MRTVIFLAPENSEKLWGRVAMHLEDEIEPVFKNMELGQAIENRLEWSLELESNSLMKIVSKQTSPVDLIAYSGGAAVSLAFMASHPELVRSATLVEPPWFGNDWWSKEERQYARSFDQVIELPLREIFNAFLNFYAPTTVAPVSSEASNKDVLERLGGQGKSVQIAWRGYRDTPLDRNALTKITGPVYLPVGGKSITRMQLSANFIVTHFENGHIQVFPSLDHFDLVLKEHQALADNIRSMWRNWG